MAQSGQYSAALADAEAAMWAARLDAAGNAPCAAMQADLDAWLDRNPRHRGALLRAQALLDLAVANAPPAQNPQPRSARPWLAGGLGLAAAMLIAWFTLDPPAQRYSTEKGELRRIALADGSALTLDAASAVRVDLDKDEREIDLKAGRALFRVAHNAARPFRVNVGPVTITDIGTVFSVSREGEAITVLVSEGEVEVQGRGGTAHVTAGHAWRISGQTPPQVTALPPSAAERAMAWSSGRLELDGETLGSALAEFNRHNTVQIRLARPSLAQEKFYGAFRLDDPEHFARAVALGTNGSVRQDGGDWVIE